MSFYFCQYYIVSVLLSVFPPVWHNTGVYIYSCRFCSSIICHACCAIQQHDLVPMFHQGIRFTIPLSTICFTSLRPDVSEQYGCTSTQIGSSLVAVAETQSLLLCLFYLTYYRGHGRSERGPLKTSVKDSLWFLLSSWTIYVSHLWKIDTTADEEQCRNSSSSSSRALLDAGKKQQNTIIK